MDKSNVVEFKREGWRDVLGTLKTWVDRIESGEQPEVVVGLLVLYDKEGGLATVGFGPQAEDLQCIAMLELAKTQLIDVIFSG